MRKHVAARAVSLKRLIEMSEGDLQRDGIVMASAEGFVHEISCHELPFENGFMIIDREKQALLDALEDIVLASFFKFTEDERNLPYIEPEAIYKILQSFLLAYCNRDISIGIGDWNNNFFGLDFEKPRFGVDLDIWTRNFFYANNCLFVIKGTEFPRAVPTIKEQILRASQFTKTINKKLCTPKDLGLFIANAAELDGVAFAKRFEKEDILEIVTRSGLSKDLTLLIIKRFAHHSF